MRRIPLCLCALALAISSTLASAQGVKISQIYGAGGNSQSPYMNDYIEIYNSGPAAQSLSGWSVQYASNTGTTFTATALPAISLGVGQYLLVQEAVGALVAGQATTLPTPEATGTIAMSATDFKVALCNSTVALATGTPTYAANPTLVDFVGAGTANWNDSAAAGAVFAAAQNAPGANTQHAIYRLGCGG